MINPKAIDLNSLPSLPLGRRAKLPHVAGIYFVVDSSGVIQYIGRSLNLKHRWIAHHRYPELRTERGIKLVWLEVDDPMLLPEIELTLIRHFRPVLNKRGLPEIVPKLEIKKSGAYRVVTRHEIGRPSSLEDSESITLKELKRWIDNHCNDGIINGEPVITDGRKELRHGLVPENLLDRALLMSAPLGYTKSEIVIIGATQLLSNAVLDGASAGRIAPSDFIEGTEFRAYLPEGLYTLIQRRKAELGWSNSQLMVMILTYFSHDPGIEKIYRQWTKELSESSGLSEAEIEQAVYDRRRYQARVKRYELSAQKGELIGDRKIAT